MKKVDFVMQGNILRVRADGEILIKPKLDTVTIKMAVKARAISPVMKEKMFSNITSELKDNGLNDVQIKFVKNRFEEVFAV